MTKTLKDIYNVFPLENDCVKFLEGFLWGDKQICPYCNSKYHLYAISKLGDRYHCNSCNTSFSVTAKTVFARTRIDLRKWFYAIYLLNAVDGKIPVRRLSDLIETTKDTALLLRSKIDVVKITHPELLRNIIEKIENHEKN